MSQIAMCCITATIILFSLIALYLVEAIRMIESPIIDDRNTKIRYVAHRYLSPELIFMYSSKSEGIIGFQNSETGTNGYKLRTSDEIYRITNRIVI